MAHDHLAFAPLSAFRQPSFRQANAYADSDPMRIPGEKKSLWNTRVLFSKRTARLDWRQLARVDVDRVMREGDFDALQENIENLTFADIEREHMSAQADSNFVKLVRLSQLIIEYLLYSQEYLEQRRQVVEQNNVTLMSDVEEFKRAMQRDASEVQALKREMKETRRLVATYETMLGIANAQSRKAESVLRPASSKGYTCTMCGKIFASHGYLVSHFQRRHPEHLHELLQSPHELHPSAVNVAEKETQPAAVSLPEKENAGNLPVKGADAAAEAALHAKMASEAKAALEALQQEQQRWQTKQEKLREQMQREMSERECRLDEKTAALETKMAVASSAVAVSESESGSSAQATQPGINHEDLAAVKAEAFAGNCMQPVVYRVSTAWTIIAFTDMLHAQEHRRQPSRGLLS